MSSYNPLPDPRNPLDERAGDGSDDEGGERGEQYLCGRAPEAQASFSAPANPGADHFRGLCQDDHVAEVHSVAGLGDGHKCAARSLELAEEHHPSDGHQCHADGVVVPRCLPAYGIVHRPFEGEGICRLEHAQEETAEADHKAQQPHRQTDGQRPAPRQFGHELAEIQPQQQVADETADIVERAISVPFFVGKDSKKCF